MSWGGFSREVAASAVTVLQFGAGGGGCLVTAHTELEDAQRSESTLRAGELEKEKSWPSLSPSSRCQTKSDDRVPVSSRTRFNSFQQD